MRKGNEAHLALFGLMAQAIKQNSVNRPRKLNIPIPVLVGAIIRSTNRRPTHHNEAKIVRLLKEED